MHSTITNMLQTHKSKANSGNTLINITTSELHFTNVLQIQKTQATLETLHIQSQWKCFGRRSKEMKICKGKCLTEANQLIRPQSHIQ